MSDADKVKSYAEREAEEDVRRAELHAANLRSIEASIRANESLIASRGDVAAHNDSLRLVIQTALELHQPRELTDEEKKENRDYAARTELARDRSIKASEDQARALERIAKAIEARNASGR